MKLCLGIIEDSLNVNVALGSYSRSDDPFVLERVEIFCDTKRLQSGVLYIAKSEDLPTRIAANKGCALVCIGMPPKSYLELALPVIVVENVQFSVLVNKINAIFFEYQQLEGALQDAVNDGKSIQQLVDLFTPFLNGNELGVMNTDFRLIGNSSRHSRLLEISGLPQPDEERMLPSDEIDFFKNDIRYLKVKDLREPFIYDEAIFVCPVICVNVFYQEEYTCRIVISAVSNPLRDYEEGLLVFFEKFVRLSYELAGDTGPAASRNSLAETFIALIKGDSVQSWQLEDALMQKGWAHSGPFLCAYIMPNDRDHLNKTLPYYCKVLNTQMEGAVAFEYDDYISLVADLSCYHDSADNFISTHREAFRDRYFRIGYSNVFSDITELKPFHKQAEIAIRTGLDVAPYQWGFKFSDLAFTYLEHRLTGELKGKYLCAPEIITLYNYDAMHATTLLPTLTNYLENQMNAVKSAGELYIHRSTMIKRLERIKELTGLDFEDSDKLAYLIISIKLLSKDLK